MQVCQISISICKQIQSSVLMASRTPSGLGTELKNSHSRKYNKLKLNNKVPLEITECIQAAQAKTVEVQLDELLETLGCINNMVAFTIANYSYTHDMMQDVFEMAHNVIGFKKAFFMVTMDVATMELACQHHYKFLAGPQ